MNTFKNSRYVTCELVTKEVKRGKDKQPFEDK